MQQIAAGFGEWRQPQVMHAPPAPASLPQIARRSTPCHSHAKSRQHTKTRDRDRQKCNVTLRASLTPQEPACGRCLCFCQSPTPRASPASGLLQMCRPRDRSTQAPHRRSPLVGDAFAFANRRRQEHRPRAGSCGGVAISTQKAGLPLHRDRPDIMHCRSAPDPRGMEPPRASRRGFQARRRHSRWRSTMASSSTTVKAP